MTSKDKKRFNDEYCDLQSKKFASYDELDISINSIYMEKDFKSSLSTAFLQHKSIKFDNGASVVGQPFPCCLLPKFLNSEEYLTGLKTELCQLKMHRKDNDLYQFHQSGDLGNVPNPHIKAFKKILNEELLPWMTAVTNIPLTETVDLTCSLYNYTDVLLCHDDKLLGRRVAFIFYLVPEWDEKFDGGTLDLFHTENGKPTAIATSLLPVWNNFVFFEVSPISFHQVAEILSDKTRISVSGWFHGPVNSTSPVPEMELRAFSSPSSSEGDIKLWINPLYLEPQVQIDIRQTFKDNSEIELPRFLQESKYIEVSQALMASKSNWKFQGPPNNRHYEEGYNLPPVVEECMNMLHSEAMCLTLSNLTGLALHDMAVVDCSDSSDDEHCSDSSDKEHCSEPVASNSSTFDLQDERHNKKDSAKTRKYTNVKSKVGMAKYFSSVRKWSHGCYTLLHDDCYSENDLDATLYFNCRDWKSIYGGYTSYVAKDETNELLRVEPMSNSLALVYTDQETSRFVKYINSIVTKDLNVPFFHDIFTVYNEQNYA